MRGARAITQEEKQSGSRLWLFFGEELRVSKVEFGFTLGVANPLYPPEKQIENWAEMVRVGQQLGFGLVSAPQHWLAHPVKWFQPIPLLSRLAAEADRIKLATGILQLPLYNPVDLAEQVATVDAMSKGRFILGVGLGYREQLFEAVGARKGDRVGRFTEAIEIMRRLWSGDEVTFHGKHFRVTKGRISMTPLQKPHPPIWMAAQSEPAVRRAGELGFAWYIPPQGDFNDVTRLWNIYKDALDKAGHPLPAVPLIRYTCIAKDKKAAVEYARAYMQDTYALYRPWGLEEKSTVRIHRTFEEEMQRALIGSPEECAEEINKYVDAFGVTHVIMGIGRPNFRHEDALETLRLIAERLMPNVGR